MTPNLKTFYNDKLAPQLREELGLKNVMQIPRLQKIVLNQGVGAAVSDKKLIDAAVVEMSTIAGQAAVPTLAKKSVANFKLREGMPIGVKVTLRGDRMFEFLERFVAIALPRVRDFRGISDKGFDGRGNYTLGIKEQIIFPEINIDKINRITGMDVTFVTTAANDREALALLKGLGLPFRTKETDNN
ncbi:MAG: 50S ribosomal protein L5 [Bacteroidetes bacterium]|jgi:large subunit ribosomal protein L5|nr:50S ribosomal protein L5 [Bacteroidota bacterium]